MFNRRISVSRKLFTLFCYVVIKNKKPRFLQFFIYFTIIPEQIKINRFLSRGL